MLIGRLPIKKLTLYQHGVAFIERRAVFNSREPLTLRFEDKEMNDVLKSLCIFDSGRGKVTGVSYETGEDLEAQLKEKAINIPENNAVLGLIEAARGYRLVVKLKDGKGEDVVMGRLLGLESATGTRYPLPPRDDEKKSSDLQIVLIDSQEQFITIPVENIQSLMLDDEFAQSDLEYFLDASMSLRKKSFKSMTVYLEGDEHDLTVGYLTTMPAWRVSYRFLYTPDGTRLQGWGIVENLLDEDLEKVNLTLLSGMPISFIYEIYTPSSIERPYVHEERAGMRIPVSFEQDADLDYELELPEYEEHEKPEYFDKGGYESAFREPEYDEDEVEKEVPLTAGSNLTTMVDSELVDLGEMFRYDIKTSISIKRGQSALVPLFEADVECLKEHLYNRDTTGKNPLVCMHIKNNLDMVLDRGPITVIDDGLYSGEAILPFTTYDAENRIAYAMDQAVECREELKRREEIKDFIREERNLKIESWLIEEYDYIVENSKDRSIMMLVEHPAPREHDIFETPGVLEETENYMRWRFKVMADTRSTFMVKQRKMAVTYSDIRTLGEKNFKKYVETGKMNGDLKDFCREILDMTAKVDGHKKKIAMLEKHVRALQGDVNRLEKNMNSLTSPGIYKDLKNRIIKEKLDGDELVAFGVEGCRNPHEKMIYGKYFDAISEQRKRISNREECIEYLREMNNHLEDIMEYRFGKKRKEYIRREPEDLASAVEEMLAQDLVQFLINPIQQGGA